MGLSWRAFNEIGIEKSFASDSNSPTTKCVGTIADVWQLRTERSIRGWVAPRLRRESREPKAGCGEARCVAESVQGRTPDAVHCQTRRNERAGTSAFLVAASDRVDRALPAAHFSSQRVSLCASGTVWWPILLDLYKGAYCRRGRGQGMASGPGAFRHLPYCQP